ncbi:MAG TPA: hypothetical protein VGD91_09545, partial [Trebonia sp.]
MQCLLARALQYPVGQAEGRRGGHRARAQFDIPGLEGPDRALGALAHVQGPDVQAAECFRHHPDLQHTRGVLAERRVVPGEPADQDVVGPQSELDGDRAAVGPQDGEESAQVIAAPGQQCLQQIGHPGPGEAVDVAGLLVLGRLPPHELVQQLRLPAVHVQLDRADVAPELADLALGLPAEGRVFFPQARVVTVEALGKVDHRRGSQGRPARQAHGLLGDEVVEVPGGQAASAQQLLQVPLHVGRVHDRLAGGQPARQGDRHAQPAGLEGKETGDLLPVEQHGDPGLGPGLS